MLNSHYMNKVQLNPETKVCELFTFPMAPLHLLKAQKEINQIHLPCVCVWEICEVSFSSLILAALRSWTLFSCDEGKLLVWINNWLQQISYTKIVSIHISVNNTLLRILKGPLRRERWNFPHFTHPAYAVSWKKNENIFFCILNEVDMEFLSILKNRGNNTYPPKI